MVFNPLLVIDGAVPHPVITYTILGLVDVQQAIFDVMVVSTGIEVVWQNPCECQAENGIDDCLVTVCVLPPAMDSVSKPALLCCCFHNPGHPFTRWQEKSDCAVIHEREVSPLGRKVASEKAQTHLTAVSATPRCQPTDPRMTTPQPTLSAAQADAIEGRRLEALRRRIASARRHAPAIFRVAGVNSYKQGCREAIESGSRDVTLTPEPTNPFDKHAIAVRVGGLLIGYVPKTDIPKVRQRMSPATTPELRDIGTWGKGFYARVRV